MKENQKVCFGSLIDNTAPKRVLFGIIIAVGFGSLIDNTAPKQNFFAILICDMFWKSYR